MRIYFRKMLPKGLYGILILFGSLISTQLEALQKSLLGTPLWYILISGAKTVRDDK
jgi:hypothetical protein